MLCFCHHHQRQNDRCHDRNDTLFFSHHTSINLQVPVDYQWAQELGLIRKSANFVSTITDERGGELVYAGMRKTNEKDLCREA
jgi:hypothetical protein